MRKLTLLCLLVLACFPPAPGQVLQIIHVDVGQGDSTLIVAPSGKTLLMDGGDTGHGVRDVLPVLAALGIDSLNFTVASHYDADHIGGLDEVIQGLTGGITETAYDRGDSHTTKAFRDYETAVGDKRKQISPGERIDMGDDIEVICVAVNRETLDGLTAENLDDENGSSVALLVRYGTFDYFVGGDLTGGGRSGSKRTPDVESLVAQKVGDVDVVRISHHGSNTSSNETFLTALRPEVAVISVGTGGKNTNFGHPRHEVLSRLVALRPLSLKRIFATERGETDGGYNAAELELMKIAEDNVIVTTNGRSYTVNGSVYATDGVNSTPPTATSPAPGGTSDE